MEFMRKVLMALIVAALAGCQTPQPEPEVFDAQQDTGPLQLEPGDVVRITFPNSPELSFEQRIQSDGTLNLPMAGEVRAGGKSPEQLQTELKSKFSSDLIDSNVLVTVEQRAAVVYVSGMVRTPGRIALNRQMTVFEAIMEAGGFIPGANQKKVSIIRNVGGQHQTLFVDLSGVMKGRQTEASYVRPYDTIVVAEGIF